MTVDTKPDLQSLFADKKVLLKILEEQDRKTGFAPDPTATIARSGPAITVTFGWKAAPELGTARPWM